MPFGDGTGPDGLGPRTGRGLGYCGGYNSPGFTRGTPRGGAGFRRGFGRSFGWRFRASPYFYLSQAIDNEQTAYEKQLLETFEEDIKALRKSIKEIENRLNELKKKE